MSRQSITLTAPNDDWLKAQVDSQEFASKSEAINALIRKERALQAERDALNAKLERAEAETEVRGHSRLSPDEILAKSKAELRRNGEL